jgi:hypothetical protein
MRAAITTAYVLPPLFLIALIGVATQSAESAGILLVALAARELILRVVKRRFLGSEIPHRSFISVLMEIIQPVFLVAAFLRTTIRWRTRIIRVRSVTQFEYL